jgi:hypothetical protein
MDDPAAIPGAKTQLKTFGRTRPSPGCHTLDLSVVIDAPLKMNGQPSTFADIFRKLRDSKIEKMPEFMRDAYGTDQGEIELSGLSGDWPLLSTMQKLIELTRQGVDPYRVMWFYYDHDSSRDADESYSFFAVFDRKVVMESCSFSWLEPLILKREPDSEPIWRSHAYFSEALERYWYRKFYTETMTGQLMVLRPDEPILYFYDRPQTRDVLRELQTVTMVKTYRLLWVAIPLLVAIVFPSVRDYMVVAAVILGLDVLWRAWATRKVGQH